jgi:hypothetical protein
MSDRRMLAASVVAFVVLAACSGESSRSERATDTAISASPSARGGTSSSRNGAVRGESLPRGMKLEGGATIPHTDYVFRRVSTPRGDSLWLDSMSTNTRGAVTRIRRAQIAVPPLAADERMMLASCDVNGRLDPFVVAIVVSEANATRFAKVRQAWRANPKTRAFDIVPVAGIVCEDPGS